MIPQPNRNTEAQPGSPVRGYPVAPPEDAPGAGDAQDEPEAGAGFAPAAPMRRTVTPELPNADLRMQSNKSNTESLSRTAKSAVEGTMDKKSMRESLREKIAARKAERLAEQKNKYARLRQVATEEPKEVEEALTEIADALATMSEGLVNLRENLDLVKAPKTASLKVRIATARKYASSFKQVAGESPEVIVDAVAEIYNSLDELAAGLENFAENLGFEIPTTPAMEDVIDEGESELNEAHEEGETVPEAIEDEAADMTDEIEEDEDVEEHVASGSDNFVMDNSTKKTEKVEIPTANVPA